MEKCKNVNRKKEETKTIQTLKKNKAKQENKNTQIKQIILKKKQRNTD